MHAMCCAIKQVSIGYVLYTIEQVWFDAPAAALTQ